MMLNVYSGEYEDFRTAKKLNNWQIYLTVFKSVARLSIFGFHQVFQKSGIWLGLLISALVLFSLNHISLRLVTFAEELESGSLETLRVENSFELIELMEMKYIGKSWLGTCMFALTLFSFISFTLGLYMTSATIFVDITGIGVFESNLLLFVLVCGLLIFAIEPERLIVFTYLTTPISMLMVAICTYFAVKELFGQNGVSPHVKKWDIKEMGMSFGYVISSVEVVSTILNFRRMMAEDIRPGFRRTSYFALYSIGLLCIFPSLLLYLAFEHRGLKDLYFKTFLDTPIIKFLYYSFSLNMILGATKNSIFSVEILEKLKFFDECLRNEQRELSTVKVFSMRIAYVLVTMGISSCFSDFRKVYSFAGIYTNSFIALIIPAGISFIRPSHIKQTDSNFTKISDVIAFSVGCFTIAIYIIQSAF